MGSVDSVCLGMRLKKVRHVVQTGQVLAADAGLREKRAGVGVGRGGLAGVTTAGEPEKPSGSPSTRTHRQQRQPGCFQGQSRGIGQ